MNRSQSSIHSTICSFRSIRMKKKPLISRSGIPNPKNDKKNDVASLFAEKTTTKSRLRLYPFQTEDIGFVGSVTVNKQGHCNRNHFSYLERMP